jgi:hypothetical protein
MGTLNREPAKKEPDYGLGPAPEFPNDVKQRLAEWRARVGKVTVRPLQSKMHPEIARMLAEDEVRASTRPDRYSLRLTNAYFEDRLGQRRLRLLNTVLLALERHGATATIRDDWASECQAVVSGTEVHFAVDTRERVIDGRTQKSLTFRLRGYGYRVNEARKNWNELKQSLDEQLSEVVVGILVAGEDNRRVSLREAHRSLVAAEHRRIWEEERNRERERQAAIEKLKTDAAKFSVACDIRALIAAARLTDPTSPSVAEWCKWALSYVASIDPVASGSVFQRSADPEPRRGNLE